MATLINLPLQYFDGLGVPLAGGFLKFYIATTLTPKNVFTAEDGITPLPNPLELDSEGRVPSAGVWGDGDYRVIITDSDNVPIYDIDNDKMVDLVDFSGLTATVSDLNLLTGSIPGLVQAGLGVVVDSSKDISEFHRLAAEIVVADEVQTPLIKDVNAVDAIEIATVSSQVNHLKLTPAATTNNVAIAAVGTDTNINLQIDPQGTGKVIIDGLTYPDNSVMDGQFHIQSGVISVVPATVIQQIQRTTITSSGSGTSIIPVDNTKPQITEGDLLLSRSITPTYVGSTLYVTVVLNVGSNSTAPGITTAALFCTQIDALNSLCTAMTAFTNVTVMNTLVLNYTFTTLSTNAHPFTVRIGSGASYQYFYNRNSSGALFDSSMISSITITEI